MYIYSFNFKNLALVVGVSNELVNVQYVYLGIICMYYP